ncbi:MAG: DUF5989 family protein [Nanoarchaeota archaeon]|nr:DUF5989 family protein [Nanoarchaeota archaeon]
MDTPQLQEEQQSLLKKAWDFLKVRKIWWMTPLILFGIMLILAVLAGDSLSIANIYAPI